MSKEKIPTNLDEAVQALVDLNVGKIGSFGGMSIRNNWGLWSGSELAQWFYAKQIYHADDMFGIIKDSYQRHINNQPRDLEGQILFYHNFWEKRQGPNHLNEMKKMVFDNIVKMRDDKIKKVIGEDETRTN